MTYRLSIIFKKFGIVNRSAVYSQFSHSHGWVHVKYRSRMLGLDIVVTLLVYFWKNVICGQLTQRARHIAERFNLNDLTTDGVRDSHLLPKISVIIPTYNEELSIGVVVAEALKDDNVEVIVSDGGSTDGTLSKISKDILLVNGGKSRALCQNIGAEHATGEILLFLHADTILPPEYGTFVRQSCSGNRSFTCRVLSYK